MRNLYPLAVVLFLARGCYAVPIATRSALMPETGVLALLGAGLVGLASLVRRHFGS